MGIVFLFFLFWLLYAAPNAFWMLVKFVVGAAFFIVGAFLLLLIVVAGQHAG